MMWMHWIAVTVAWLSIISAALGQTSQPASAPNPEDMSIEHGIRLLAGVKDHVFSFDDPGFYWFCRFVRADADSKAYDAATNANSNAVTPTRYLMERPNDYRGTLVQIEGRLLRKGAFEVPNRAGIGRLIQCEIGEWGSRAVCTAVLTEDPGDIPVGSAVQVRGYFIKARSFQTTKGEAGSGPLVVSKRLSRTVESPVSADVDSDPSSSQSGKWLLTGTAVLFIFWIVLRRYERVQKETTLQRAGRRPVSQTEGDFDWLTEGRQTSAESKLDQDKPA